MNWPRVRSKARDCCNCKSDVGTSGKCSPVEHTNCLPIGHVAHGCELGWSCWCMLTGEPDLCVHWHRKRLEVSKVVVAQDRVEVCMLGEMDGACFMISVHLDPEHPVELSKIGNLDMLPQTILEVHNKLRGAGSDGTVIHMHSNHSGHTCGCVSLEKDCLVDLALSEAQGSED